MGWSNQVKSARAWRWENSMAEGRRVDWLEDSGGCRGYADAELQIFEIVLDLFLDYV